MFVADKSAIILELLLVYKNDKDFKGAYNLLIGGSALHKWYIRHYFHCRLQICCFSST
jgi:hypothetical protein